jgi:hypothetical protein
MIDNLTSDTQDLTEEELVAYSIKRQAYAANFFRRQVARYEQHLEPSAVTAFTRWWNSRRDSFRLFTETQQKFDGQAFPACDSWLERWMKRKANALVTGEVEKAPTSSQDDEANRIRAAWGLSTLDAKRIRILSDEPLGLLNQRAILISLGGTILPISDSWAGNG